MPTFTMKFGQALADETGHMKAPVYSTISALHYALDVPYSEADLTDEARRFIAWQAGRDLYPRRNPAPVSQHPDPMVRRAYAGANDDLEFGPQPHANTAADLADCTAWLNTVAAASGFFAQ